MQAERAPTQRNLVDLPLHLSDRRLWVEHAFPFVDRHWRVAFFLLDIAGDWPRVLRDRLRLEPGGLFSHASADSLAPMGSVPLEELAVVVHFDPWWVLKDLAPRVPPSPAALQGWPEAADPAWIAAYKETNIAIGFTHGGKSYAVADLAFESSLASLVEVRARGTLGRAHAFRPGDLDLLALRRPPRR